MKPIDSAAGGLKIPLIHRSARSRACIGRKPIVLAAGRSKTSLVPRGGRTKTAGQSSVELLIVLAISLVLLAALVDFTVNQVSRVEKQHAIRLGQEGVQRLIREIDEVYSLGPGNTRDIIIPWPRGVDSSRSRLEGRSIILQVYDFQIAGTAIPSLRGTIPSQPGLVRFRLVSDADSVLISLSTVTSDVDSVYVAMPRDANASARVVFSNTGTQDADTVLVWTWDHTLVDASIGPSVFTLSPGESQNVDLNFYSESTAIGNYVGYLTMNADISGTPESITIPVNVEVFPNTQGLLTSVPSVLRFSTLGADTNSLTLQLCNVGQTPLTNLSFTPSSGNAGDWITPISIISSLSAQSCQNVNVEVTVPGGTDLGLYTGSVSITDFTGANHLILGVEVQVNGGSAYFQWDWSGATAEESIVDGFTLRNTGSQPLVISSIILQRWWNCDTERGVVNTLVIDGNTVFSGSGGDGDELDVSDVTLSASGVLSDNEILFSSVISDENEQFQPVVSFGDGTQYTGTILGSGCAQDITPPGSVLNFTAESGSDAESVLLRFTYPGDDNYSGTVSSAVVKYSPTSIATPAQFDAANSFSFNGPFLQGGSAGTILVTDLNAGLDYYFSLVFLDEADNNSGFSNSPVARPRNTFRYSLGDFDIIPFARTYAGTPPLSMPDVNQFLLTKFVSSSGDKNVHLRIADDTNANNTYIVTLGFNSTRLRDVRVWYPVANTPGVPGSAPNYVGDPSYPFSLGINLLSTTIINSNYRYDGNAVHIPSPTRLHLDLFQGFSDMNAIFDQHISLGGV